MDFSTGLDCHERRRPTPAAERRPGRLAAWRSVPWEMDRPVAAKSRTPWGPFYPEAHAL